MTTRERRRVRFRSAGTACVAWLYVGSNGACVVMAGGFAVPKEPATDLFAAAFHRAGYSVLAFDYRHLGESGGTPRLVLSPRTQRQDWMAAIDAAAALPGVSQVVLWGFSATGGLVLPVAARHPDVRAVIAQTPNVGGWASLRNAMRYQTPAALLRVLARGVRDTARGLRGIAPLLIPLIGSRGDLALLTTPDAAQGPVALRAQEYPQWSQTVAARSALQLSTYRPGRWAARVPCPLLVVVCTDDCTAPPGAAARAAAAAPRGRFVRLPGSHYSPFLDGHEHAAAVQIAFLDHVLAEPDPPANRPRSRP